jgi:hypothetical protein
VAHDRPYTLYDQTLGALSRSTGAIMSRALTPRAVK